MWNQQKGTRHTIRNLFTKHEGESLPGPIIPESEIRKEEKKNEEIKVEDLDMVFDAEVGGSSQKP
jgi:hypothetical protein